jgi:aspartyl-tRNA(Asn)/glutamyl-tRNA(Gln) amidotransferase subunit A
LARPDRRRDGVPLAVKDLFDTAGLVTTYGSAIFRDHIPDRTAESVLLLEAAGYANVGKTNLHEFAYGITSENPHYGEVPNPVAPGRIAGGSSGGSAAALAAGLADAALGSDSGGSIRIPAACCGVVGFKPTHGLVAVDGCFPLAPTFDHVGPMAREVDTCAAMMEVLVPGFDPRGPESFAEIEVGLAWTEQADLLVGERVETATRAFPRRRRVTVPFADDIAPVFMREVADTHRQLWAEHRDLYGEDLAAKIERCMRVTDEEYEAGLLARVRYRERMAELFDEIELLITPTLAMVAPPLGLGDLALRERMIRLTFPFNATGQPALAIPRGPAEDGLPASMQLVGRRGEDALVLAAGRLFERESLRP